MSGWLSAQVWEISASHPFNGSQADGRVLLIEIQLKLL
jgi:hypothetical protein